MIKIYNTLKGTLEEFIPTINGEVSMYVCGPTVYNYIHIGNARPVIFFDTVRRYFEYKGYKVKYVSNFTDVDDKMINKANEEGITLKEVADKYISAFLEDTGKLNLKEEGMIRPKATEHIGEMIKIIKELEAKGFAYMSQGDVYFNVEKYENYAELSHQKIEDLISGSRIDVNEQKKNPLDFTLWKASKEGEPSWGSPWGQGRPGWHIECSAMSKKFLGDTFDIHGGGQDLIFPHHENEIAQSKCAHEGEYARYWMHNGYINIKGEKMSKSLGNFTLLRDILKSYEGRIIRFFMLSSHYRKPIDFSDEELNMAKSAIERIENTLSRINDVIKNISPISIDSKHNINILLDDTKNKIELAMNDDFNTAKAMGGIFELVKDLNKIMDSQTFSQNDLDSLKFSYEFIENIITNVFGVLLNTEAKLDGTLSEELLDLILNLRLEIKKEKNYTLADSIRDSLAKLGIEIKDGKDKTTWILKK